MCRSCKIRSEVLNMKKPTIAVLIPCYNESQTIAKVINGKLQVQIEHRYNQETLSIA